MLLRVRGPGGQTTLKLEPDATVAALKALLEERTGVPAALQEASAGCRTLGAACCACWVLCVAGLFADSVQCWVLRVAWLFADSVGQALTSRCCSKHLPYLPVADHATLHSVYQCSGPLGTLHPPLQVRAGFPPRPLTFPPGRAATVASLGLQRGDSLTVTQLPGTAAGAAAQGATQPASARTAAGAPAAAARPAAAPAAERQATTAAAAAAGSLGGADHGSACSYCFEPLSPFQRYFCLSCCPSAASAPWHACHVCAVQRSASGGLPAASKVGTACRGKQLMHPVATPSVQCAEQYLLLPSPITVVVAEKAVACLNCLSFSTAPPAASAEGGRQPAAVLRSGPPFCSGVRSRMAHAAGGAARR